MLGDLVEHERRERVDVADREVDLAADQQHRLAHRRDQDRRAVLHERRPVAAAREGAVLGVEVQDQRDEDEEDPELAPRDEGRDEAAAGRCRPPLDRLGCRHGGEPNP